MNNNIKTILDADDDDDVYDAKDDYEMDDDTDDFIDCTDDYENYDRQHKNLYSSFFRLLRVLTN